ncbi:MAG TPA: helix-turn-helix domain-containing protein [Gammaproteobacteria bacterium]|nr:helix-turn-helix domain-containing protein [Gammaproteobacteria bacterium]
MQKTLHSDAIRNALAERGLTQKDLALQIGVSAQAITNWLKGKDFPRPPALLKLAAALHLGFDELVQNNDTSRPVVAFRKKGNAKTGLAHIKQAKEMGLLLKPLVPYLPEQQALRTLITSPSTDYHKLQAAVSQTRQRLGIGEHAEMGYEPLIGEFRNSGAVLVPVMWGEKHEHKNALHIRLPREDVTFILINLDTRVEDFKFWMAHELAHVYTPELAGTEEGEDFADAFAGALLFPESCVETCYQAISRKRNEQSVIKALFNFAQEHLISINTVYRQVQDFARAKQLPALKITENKLHATRNHFSGPLISELLFAPLPPTTDVYIAACEHQFQSDFFIALKKLLNNRDTGPGYLQQILDISLRDAKAIYEELRH